MRSNRKSIVIAGFEIGGQMHLLAKTFRAKGYRCDSVVFNRDKRQFSFDVSLSKKGYAGILQRLSYFFKSIHKYDVYYFFWGKSFLDTNAFYNVDLPILRKLGKIVIMHYRGSDILNLQYYHTMRQVALGEGKSGRIKKQTEVQKKRVLWCARWANQILVSTPNLLELVPPASENVKLSPQVLDLTEWKPDYFTGNFKAEKIRIVHAPTRRFVKGTDLIIDAIEALKKKGYNIELKLIEDLPYREMKKELASCHFGIDQLFSGWYGKISVELMALGKPVFCFIQREYEEMANFQLPIIRTTATTIEYDLMQFLSLPDSVYRRIGEAGRQFVEQHHDVNQEVVKLISVIDSFYSTLN